MQPLVIVYTRLPQAGRSKTRLIPALGAEGAAALQAQMSEQLIARLSGDGLPLRIDHADGDCAAMQDWLGKTFIYQAQSDGDLGARLEASFASAFAAGHDRVCIVGCDVPAIKPTHIHQAWAALSKHEAVMGPATDGGYWLIGLRQEQPCLWPDMPWGSERVAAETRARCRAAGLSLAELCTLSDVDRPEDLHVWDRERDDERY